MSVSGIFCVFLCVSLLSTYVNANESCYTPNNQPGSCIVLNKCPSLVQLLQNRPIPPDDLDFLRQSSCGYEGTLPKVCCSTGTVPVTKPATATPRPQTIPTAPPNTGSSSNVLPGLNICGISAVDKIVGGEETELNEFPWMALLEYQKPVGRGFYCGGVLISSRYVLTAAHCIKGKDLPKTWSLISVRLGEYDTNNATDCEYIDGNKQCAPDPIDVSVETQIAHEQYNPNNVNQYNDIALLRLARPVSFTEFVRPICLPSPTNQLNDLYVAGWGKTETKSESNVKLKVKVPLVEQGTCSQQYTKASVTLGSSQICAGGQKGKDSCRGDSGGPLMTLTYDRLNQVATANWVVAGIVSFGPSPCGMKGWPGVYTHVPDYISWITRTVQP